MITRKDFEAISHWIKPGTAVLDLGCGDGELLVYLQASRNIIGYRSRMTAPASSPAWPTA